MDHEAAELPAGASQPARAPGGGRARGDTRERIQSVALELFAEHGYQQTSLREIAERLGVTKAALYYHFKSKEDIVRSFTEDYAAELDALLTWGADQPRSPATRAALLTRYSDIVQQRLGVLRFLEQNQAAVHHLMSENGARDNKRMFREQFENLRDLLAPPGCPAGGAGARLGGRGVRGPGHPALPEGGGRPRGTARDRARHRHRTGRRGPHPHRHCMNCGRTA